MKPIASLLLVLACFLLSACGGSAAATGAEEAGGSAPSCSTMSCPPNQACVEGEEGPTCACTSMAMCVAGHVWDEERCECVQTATASAEGEPTGH